MSKSLPALRSLSFWRAALLVAAVIGSLRSQAVATTFNWNFDGNGSWQSSFNWTPFGTPSNENDVAVFGSVISGPVNVFSFSDETVGGIVFDNLNSYTIANSSANQITLDGPGANSAFLNVDQGDHFINENLRLAADLDVTILENHSLTLSGVSTLLSSPTITKTGGGDLRFNGFTGLNGGSVFGLKGTISGTGEIGGNLDNSGATVSPGENGIGTFFVQQNYVQGQDASVAFELAGTSPSQHDRLVVFGDASFGGSLNVDLFSGYSPNVGDEYTVMTFASSSGSFDNVSLPFLLSGNQFQAIFNDTDVRMKVGRHINWVGGTGVKFWNNPNNWQFNFIPDDDSIAAISGFGTTLILDNNIGAVLGVQLTNLRNLRIDGSTGPAELQVLGSVTLDASSSLDMIGSQSQLNASTISTRGQIFVDQGASITASHKYVQNGGSTSLQGILTAEDVNIQQGLFTGNGEVRGNLSVGTATTNAQLSPGVGIGSLTVNGNVDLNAGSELLVELDGSGPSLVADQLVVNGNVDLGGTLNLNVFGSPDISINEKIEIIAGETFEPGQLFDEITGLVTDNGSLIVTFLTDGWDTIMTVSLHSSQMLGDMNGDSTVDDLDAELFAWALRDSDTYYDEYILGGGGADESMADMDSDGDLTFADIPAFLTAVEMSGSSVAAASAAMAAVFSAAVPEPNTLLLLAIGMPFAINYRNRTAGQNPKYQNPKA
ncbi:MAG: PEP-CTERM sorting domain-containing protein [Lacipirellulaceae bacterium]